MSENPPTIQLRFEPKGRSHLDDSYYLADKANQCCVCGSGEKWLRHHVVPTMYRKHFAVCMKSRLAHDIVLLCPRCHRGVSRHASDRVQAIATQFNAPLELVRPPLPGLEVRRGRQG